MRNKRRLIILGILIGIYFGVMGLDWIIDNYVLPAISTEEGAFKITKRHFQQPKEWVFTPANFVKFLDRVTEGKPGILGHKWFYIVLLGAYLLLIVIVFLKLTDIE